MTVTDEKNRKRSAAKTKIMALRVRLIYIILRLCTWGAIFLGSKFLRSCIPTTDVPKTPLVELNLSEKPNP